MSASNDAMRIPRRIDPSWAWASAALEMLRERWQEYRVAPTKTGRDAIDMGFDAVVESARIAAGCEGSGSMLPTSYLPENVLRKLRGKEEQQP